MASAIRDPASAGTLLNGVAVTENAKGIGFIIYSAEKLNSRYLAVKSLFGNAEHFVAVRYAASGWE